jgi:hypothetical protein
MHPRIQELKNQAMLFAQEKCEGQSRDMYGTLRADIMTEKFAELIVRACADVLHQDAAFMPELGVYAHDMVVNMGFKYE